MSAPVSMSAMLWFRADRREDAAVRSALLAASRTVAPLTRSRIGHRHQEDRPYRTWMIDAGPVPLAEFDALAAGLREALLAAGIGQLAQGEWQLERFEWLGPDE